MTPDCEFKAGLVAESNPWGVAVDCEKILIHAENHQLFAFSIAESIKSIYIFFLFFLDCLL